MTALSSNASKPRRNQLAASSFQIPSRKSPHRARSLPLGQGGRDEAGNLIPIDVKVGDRVLFGKWSGTEVKIDGQELLIMKESDITGIIDEPVAKKKAA